MCNISSMQHSKCFIKCWCTVRLHHPHHPKCTHVSARTCRISRRALAVMRLSVKLRRCPSCQPLFDFSPTEYHLSVPARLALSSSLCVEVSCPGSSLWGASCECCASSWHLEQQQSAAQRRVRSGRVSSTNMIQLAAPCEVLPIPCWVQTKAFKW